MNSNSVDSTKDDTKKSRIGCLQVFGVLAMIVVITALLMAWWVKYNVYASEFKPTTLSANEEKILNSKLARLDESAGRNRHTKGRNRYDSAAPLIPEPYSETGLKREISLTEKELNALVGYDPEVAQRVAIDLSDDLVSVKLVVPVDEEVVVLGGKILRVSLGIILSYENE